jgi:hypothetical protein
MKGFGTELMLKSIGVEAKPVFSKLNDVCMSTSASKQVA